MWHPDTIQISKSLIQAELDQKIPEGTTVATAAFTMNLASKETAKEIVTQFHLDRDAAKIAWKFLQTGQIVTSDGEILTETSVAVSPSRPVAPSRPTAPSVSSTNADRRSGVPVQGTANARVVEEVKSYFKRYYPNWTEPTSDQCMTIMNKVGDIKYVDNALYIMANGKREINNPITLLLWMTNNKSFEQVQQEREIIERQGVSGDSIVRKAMREAEAQIPALPTPTTTKHDVDLLKELREKVERARN